MEIHSVVQGYSLEELQLIENGVSNKFLDTPFCCLKLYCKRYLYRADRLLIYIIYTHHLADIGDGLLTTIKLARID